MHELTLTQLLPLMELHIKARKNFLIVGPPGIGKTESKKQVTEKLGIDLLITNPGMNDPTYYGGLYFVSEGKARIIPLSDLEKVLNTQKRLHVFIDDLGQASQAVQKTLFPWLYGDHVQGFKINRDLVSISAATNNLSDKSGVVPIFEAIKSRFVYIHQLKFDLASWIQYAFDKGLDERLIAFVKFERSLFDFIPSNEITPSITARTYTEFALDFPSIPSNLLYDCALGNLGEKYGTNLISFLALMDKLPNLNNICKGIHEDHNLEASILYTAIIGLVRKLGFTNEQNIYSWIEKLPIEFQGLFIALAKNAKSDIITNSQFYSKWIISNQNLEKF